MMALRFMNASKRKAIILINLKKESIGTTKFDFLNSGNHKKPWHPSSRGLLSYSNIQEIVLEAYFPIVTTKKSFSGFTFQ